MNNAVSEIQAEMPDSLLKGGQAGGHAEPESEWRLADGAAMINEADFDERGYLCLNPDVAAAVARGDLPSGFHHYMVQGFGEGRRVPGPPAETRNRILRPAAIAVIETGPTTEIPFNVEALIATSTGAIMVMGWIDDSSSPLKLMRIGHNRWRVLLDSTTVFRIRRSDVENTLKKPIIHHFGFIGFLHSDEPLVNTGLCGVEAWLENGTQMQAKVKCVAMTETELRNKLLAHLAGSEFHGNQGVERIAAMDGGVGDQVIAFNRAITRRLVASPYTERFGNATRSYKGSIVVALYGKPEYLHVQNALYSGLHGIEDYEFIYVSNSPELGETLLREAKIGSAVYGINQSVMILYGNAGFGAANNAALSAMRSNRVMNVNPDVFPRDKDWAATHTALIDSGGPGTRLFGTPLYYDDGSLMHGGMYFEADTALSVVDSVFRQRSLLRVEHYGKGTPAEGTGFVSARPVPAVTGAFISSDRSWFERLGGFTEDFVFGHYEDADLCLKSLECGTPAWLQDIRLWHLEGKGSTRLPPQEGGSSVNRWLFSRRWNDFVANSLLGPAPSHPAFTPASSSETPSSKASSTKTPAPKISRVPKSTVGIASR
jgi:GT2 family glycosyltransferase